MRSARTPAAPSDPAPPFADPTWQAFKDAVYRVLAEPRAPSCGAAWPDTLGILGARLAALRPVSVEPALQGALYDKAYDVGRLVCAKRVMGDDLTAAVENFSRFLGASGLGTLELTARFHRAATLRVLTAEHATPCDPALRDTFLAGALHGLLEEAFNCRVQLFREPPDLLDVHLAEGRDVNLEAHTS